MAKKNQYWNYAKYANMALSFGITMITGIFLGFYGGGWLDRRFGTAPWLMLAGILLGVGVGFRSIWSELRALEKDLNRAKIDRKIDDEDKNHRD